MGFSKDDKPVPVKDPKPGDDEIDIDDAQIEPPRDDVFEKGDQPPQKKTA